MSDKIIRFPGAARALVTPAAAEPAPEAAAAAGPDGLTDDQRKAVQLVLSGMSFVMVAIKPTERGADFFTAVHGDAAELRNAQPHLDGVIGRAYARKGL
jgi:hypothetical protein